MLEAFILLMIEGFLFFLSLVFLHIQKKRKLNLLENIVTYLVFTLLIIGGVILAIYDFFEGVNYCSSKYIKIAVFYAIVFVLYLLLKEKINNLSKYRKTLLILIIVLLSSYLYLFHK